MRGEKSDVDRAAEKPCLDLVRDLANDRRNALDDMTEPQKTIFDFNALNAFERSGARFCGEHRATPAHDLGYPESSIAKDVREPLDQARHDAARGRLPLVVFFFGDDRASDRTRCSIRACARRAREIDVDVDDDRRAPHVVAMTTTRSVSSETERAAAARRHEKRRAHRSRDADPHRDGARCARRAIDHSGLCRTTRATRIAAC